MRLPTGLGVPTLEDVRAVLLHGAQVATCALALVFAAGPSESATFADEGPTAGPDAVSRETGGPAESTATDLPAGEKTPPDKAPTEDRSDDKTAADSTDAPAENPLKPIVRVMRSAEALIAEKRVGEEARALQDEAIRRLDELIKQAERNRRRNPSPQEGSTISRSGQGTADDDPSGTRRNVTGEVAGEGPRRNAGPADRSTERTDRGEATSAELARRNALMRDVWGHLPPAALERLMNVYSERYLPQYEEVIRRYYEALAEQHRKANLP